MARSILLSAFVLALALVGAEAHARWKCPLPRDWNDENGQHITFNNTANKHGPCGPYSGKWGMGAVTTVKPGWNTFEWEESIAHVGAPFQIAILDETEVSRVVLLDHIPHWDAAAPNPQVESSYVPYKISFFVPDVFCEKCIIRVLYVMTDKSVKCGLEFCTYYPEDSECSGHTDPSLPACAGASSTVACQKTDTCFSSYHSCADVKITGRFPLEVAERHFHQPWSWPFRNNPSGRNYSSESATWKDGWLQGVPAEYSTQANDYCGTIIYCGVV